ncbi:MAG: efflux RND transporter periplasmic adaptor subunit [Candidatus Korobacteraceae bacterium]
MKKHNYVRHVRHVLALFGCSLVVSLALGCSSEKSQPLSDKVVETNVDPDVVTMQNPGQFQLTPAQVRKVGDEVHVNCVVSPDVNRSIPVVSLGGGRVVEINAKLGDNVTKGQPLLMINSPDLSGAFSDYQKAKADELLAEKQLARSKLLYDKGAIALADLETVQDAADKAKVDLDTSVAHVKVLGGDINNPTPLLPLRAPISGTIVDQQITTGTGVRSLDNQQALFTIADLSEVWILCDVYQDMLSRVHVGDIAGISVEGYGHDQFSGKVINISQVLDPTTRTAKVRIEQTNPHSIFKAGMYVTAMFRARDLVERVVVPTTAIIRLHDANWVFVPEGGGKFRRVKVELGPEMEGGYQQVISGLSPNAQVVNNALQFSSASEEK